VKPEEKAMEQNFLQNFFDLYLPIFIPHVLHTQLSAATATALTGGGAHYHFLDLCL
jgi:hypothetical protein